MKKNAFTLVELIAVIVLLGLITMIAVPNYNKYIAKVRIKKCEADKNTIEDLIKLKIEEDTARNEYINYTGIAKEISFFENILIGKLGSQKYNEYSNKYVKIIEKDIDGITAYDFEFFGINQNGEQIDFCK